MLRAGIYDLQKASVVSTRCARGARGREARSDANEPAALAAYFHRLLEASPVVMKGRYKSL